MCKYPQLVKNRSNIEAYRLLRPYVLASCGFCSECLSARIASIIFRAHVVNTHTISFLEQADLENGPDVNNWTLPHSRMITLTIAPDYLKGKPEPHIYIRKFRDTWRKKYPFQFPRHILVPEYGMNEDYTRRLHFHGLFFDIPGTVLLDKLDCWTFGRVDISDYFTEGAVFYATKYLSKITGADYDSIRSPFMPHYYKLRPYISQNFGKELLFDYSDIQTFAENVPLEKEIGHSSLPLPSYYDRFLANTPFLWTLLKRRLYSLKEVVVGNKIFEPADLKGILKEKRSLYGERPSRYKGVSRNIFFQNPKILDYE